MKKILTLAIVFTVAFIVCTSNSPANDYDVLRNDIQQMGAGDIGPQSSMSERYDPPETVYVETDTTPSMPDTTQSSLTDYDE